MTDLDTAAAQWAAARSYEQAAREAVSRAVIAEHAAGAKQADLVRRSGAERQAVRGWLGLRRRYDRSTRAHLDTTPAPAHDDRTAEPFEESP